MSNPTDENGSGNLSQQTQQAIEWRREAQARIAAWPQNESDFRRQAIASLDLLAALLEMHLNGVGAPGFRIDDENLQRLPRAIDLVRRLIETATVIDEPEKRQAEADMLMRSTTRVDTRFSRMMDAAENPADDVGDEKE